MLKKILRHPFLWLAGITLGVMAVGPLVPLEYDDHSIGTAWFLVVYVITSVFRFTAALADRLTGQEAGPLHMFVTLALGLIVYVLLDLAWLKLFAMRKTRQSSTSQV